MKLVPDWKQFPKWFSTWVAAAAAAAPLAWAQIPEDVRATIPPEWIAVGGAVGFVLFLVARLVDQ